MPEPTLLEQLDSAEAALRSAMAAGERDAIINALSALCAAAAARALIVVEDIADGPAPDDTHPCADCGETYYERMGSYWLADDQLWQRVVGTDRIVLCPACFAARARAAGVVIHWATTVDVPPAPVETPEERAHRELHDGTRSIGGLDQLRENFREAAQDA